MKKTFTAILVAAFCATALHAGAFELETVEPLQTDISHETETKSVLSAAVTPGANFLTGTKNLLTFDNAGDEDSFYTAYFSDKKIVESPVTQEGEEAIDPDGKYGKMVALERDMTKNAIEGTSLSNEGTTAFLTLGRKLEPDRYYLVTWNQYVDYKEASCLDWCLFPLDANAKYDLNKNEGNELASNTWQQVFEARMPGKDVALFYQIDVGEERGVKPNKTTMLYMDNVGIYPYYKINYHNPDGSVNTEQVLFAGGMKIPENIIENYSVKTDNFSTQPVQKDDSTYRMIGWAQSENASVAESVIPLAGADVDLYPVWEDMNKPVLADEVSVHTADPVGIRFKASVHKYLMTLTERDVEIGFVVARETEESLALIEEFSEDGELSLDVLPFGIAVKGSAYTKKADGTMVGKNYLRENTDGVTASFTACMIGIPEGHYTENILVRPYVTIGSVNYYGTVKRESLYNAAKNCPEQDDETVKEIIAKGDSEKA